MAALTTAAGPESYPPIVQTPTIDAVLFTVNDALGTGEFWQGSVLGNMTIDGAIVSNFMDVEGEFGGGGHSSTGTTRRTSGTTALRT